MFAAGRNPHCISVGACGTTKAIQLREKSVPLGRIWRLVLQSHSTVLADRSRASKKEPLRTRAFRLAVNERSHTCNLTVSSGFEGSEGA